MRSICIASGKGGVGKTSIAVNLGLLLAQMGRRTIVVDADFAMANVGILLGIERAPISLHNVLMGETSIKDAIYEGPFGLKYIPSGLSAERVKKLSLEKLQDAIEELSDIAEYVLIDCPPGLERDAEAAILSSKEMLLVLTPDPASLADGMKVYNFALKNNIQVVGIVVNMILGDRSEIKKEDLETLLNTKVVALIPEDLEMRKATTTQIPLVIKNPQATSARALRYLAAALTGEPMKAETRVKKGLLASIVDAIFGIFRK